MRKETKNWQYCTKMLDYFLRIVIEYNLKKNTCQTKIDLKNYE